jgi:enterochelin esterase-like enzyme
MPSQKTALVQVKEHIIPSECLERDVTVDFYLPTQASSFDEMSLLLVNDGQDLRTMQFENILDDLYDNDGISSLICVGIHCSTDRKNEYGTANVLDYKGRGARAGLYNQFVFEELLPYIRITLEVYSFREKAFAGFSLGGLSAIDIVWNNCREFSKVGVFSGSFWWRDVDADDPEFDENEHRIMQRQVREGQYAPWLKFFFEVGTFDETEDRNNNGVIDSIDDTLALIDDLVAKGYNRAMDIRFLVLKDGRHDVPTWARAFPDFLKWGWGTVDTPEEISH